MIVADGSAVILAVADATSRGRDVRARFQTDGPVAAPHLIDAEVGQGLRGLLLRRAIQSEGAELLLVDAFGLVRRRYAHRDLANRAWELRDNVTFYDGLYVALAEHLGTPLLTTDRKLSNATGPRCAIELV